MPIETTLTTLPAPSQQAERLRAKAQELEAAFLTEMLKSAGVGKTSDSFGGGAGEEAFSSFMTRAYAEKMTAAGGIGLTESIVRALSEDRG